MTSTDVESEVTRRNVLRSTAAAGGTAATGGAFLTLGGAGTASAAGLVDCDMVTSASGAIAGGAIGGPGGALVGGTIGYNVGQAVCPGEVDRSAEQQEADWENWVEMYNRAREGQLYDENQLTAARRDAGGMRHQGIVDAMAAAADEAATGADKSTGEEAAVDAAEAQLTKTYEGFWNHWELRAGRLASDHSFIQSSDFSTNVENILETRNAGSSSWGRDWFTELAPTSEVDVDLPDGSTMSVTATDNYDASADFDSYFCMFPGLDGDTSAVAAGNDASGNPSDTAVGGARMQEPDSSLYDAVDESEVDDSDFDGDKVYLSPRQFYDCLEELDAVRENTINQVEDLVDEHWDALVAGEIEPNEITGMAGVIDSMQNADSFREIVTGFKSSGHWVADTATVVELDDPEGEGTIEVDGQFSFNRENEPDPLPVGQEVDPSELAGDLYFAYNVIDDSSEVIAANYTIARNPFTIVTAESGASEITWTRNAISETDVTVEEIRTVLEDIEESRQDAETARQDINVESGGGFSLFGEGSTGLVGSLISVVAIIVAIVFGYNIVSDDS